MATKWEDAVGDMTGNEDLSATDNPVLYPVPVSEELRLSNILNVTMIEIYDLTGRKIISVKTETSGYCKNSCEPTFTGIIHHQI